MMKNFGVTTDLEATTSADTGGVTMCMLLQALMGLTK